MTACSSPPHCPEVNEIDFCVRVKGVLVQRDSTTSVMGNAKVIREALVEILNRILKGNHVTCHRNVFFSGSCSPSRSRIPAQDAEACLLKQGTLLSKQYSGLSSIMGTTEGLALPVTT